MPHHSIPTCHRLPLQRARLGLRTKTRHSHLKAPTFPRRVECLLRRYVVLIETPSLIIDWLNFYFHMRSFDPLEIWHRIMVCRGMGGTQLGERRTARTRGRRSREDSSIDLKGLMPVGKNIRKHPPWLIKDGHPSLPLVKSSTQFLISFPEEMSAPAETPELGPKRICRHPNLTTRWSNSRYFGSPDKEKNGDEEMV